MNFDWLTARPIAHRGWHGLHNIENTRRAAMAAIGAGFSIECDIQRTADGEAVVFHDATLERLTDAQGQLGEMTLAQLRGVALRDSNEHISTLGELLSTIDGRVALICEIKSGFDGDTRLIDRAVEIAEDYDGALAFMSFDPDVIAYLRDGRCRRPLGIVAQASYDDPYFAAMSPAQKRDCVAFLHVGRTRPEFLSWRVDDLPHATPTLMRALSEKPVMAWTVRTPEQWALAREYADQAVFEGDAEASASL